MRKGRVYLDHNATTPLRPEVREVLTKFISDPLANPSSVHQSGQYARKLVDNAREEIASLLGANAGEIVFTSGGTEAAHLAWNAFSNQKCRIVTTKLEHACVLAAAESAKSNGAHVTYVDPGKDGGLSADDLNFLSIQHANNETGLVYPVKKWAQAARLKGASVHTDAVQTLGKLVFDVHDVGADLVSLSGHKLGAPAGIGALYVRRGTPFTPIWEGGPQEKGRRPGTENVLGILCLAEACRAVKRNRETESKRVENLRGTLEKELTARIDGIQITGLGLPRLPNTSHLMIDGVDGESLVIAADLEGIDCSMGSACSSGSLKPSHVLVAMGYPPERAKNSVRLSLGWNTTEEDIEFAVTTLPKLVAQVRNAGQNYARQKAI